MKFNNLLVQHLCSVKLKNRRDIMEICVDWKLIMQKKIVAYSEIKLTQEYEEFTET